MSEIDLLSGDPTHRSLLGQGANIALRLTAAAERWPAERAIVFPAGRDARGRVAYTQRTFAQLDAETDALAGGLQQLGVTPGQRLVLMVRPSIEFIALTFAIFKTGAVVVLIDPGMGRRQIFRCLDEIDPHGFVALPIVHVIRRLRWGKYRQARLNVSVGNRLQFGGVPYDRLLEGGCEAYRPVVSAATDQAAIIFTSGSTGPPKGVVYEHGMFNAQVDLIQRQYAIEPGERDLPGFPLFALFNLAMGVTTVIPEMDPTRPAHVDPEKILNAFYDQAITQAYGSPAMWNRVGRHCRTNGLELPRLKRVLSAGAPVPVAVLETMQSVCSGKEAEIHTPYGATEALPICTIGSREVLRETAEKTRQGAGTCVGRPFPEVEVRVIAAVEGPVSDISQGVPVPSGKIGEIIVRGPSVTREYFRRPEATAAAKIPDADSFWHRMGDMGYLDEQGRLWFCGRKAHIVHTQSGPMYPVPCEAIFNCHPRIYRSALVGVGRRGAQQPVLVAEPEPGDWPGDRTAAEQLTGELLALGAAHPLTREIRTILFHRSLPVDRRHNVKIHREELAVWAASRISQHIGPSTLSLGNDSSGKTGTQQESSS